MEKLFERMFKSGLITTLLGFIIILISVFMVYTHKFNFMEISGWLGLGLAFLRSKDTILFGDKKNQE